MDDSIDLEFSVTYRHRIFFTEDAFRPGNRVLSGLFGAAKVIPMVDSGLASARPEMLAAIQGYGRAEGVNFTRAPLVLTGGEAAKKDSAVVNDLALLASLDARGLRDGLVEAVKVSLLKDPAFFTSLEKDAPALARGDLAAVGRAVRRSAELHARHIAGNGDPFELGSARPLDLGHWAAHKLESMTDHRLTHGEAVAVGLALDLLCARDLGIFPASDAERSLALLAALGFRTYAPEMHLEGGAKLLAGLEEFREHLGGELTLVLPTAVGASTQVHEMPAAVVRKAADELRARDVQPCAARS